ncbi:MAG: response regulator [Chloroflexi bacterium]|nr:response regulator [Chloroflexota bacterium]
MGKTKILLADDDTILRRLVAATLGGDEEYELLEAADGAEALDIARRERPRLMLLDVDMPKLDGFEVCAAVKGDPATRDTMVIMLTAMAQDVDRKRGEHAGANAYFTKPFSPIRLLETIDAALRADT